MTALTYLQFHAIVLLPPIVLLGLAAWYREHTWWDRQSITGLGVITVLAILYTVPWDGYLIRAGVWDYPTTVVIDRVWSIPPGEYLFFILQPVLTALWLYQFIDTVDMSLGLSFRTRLAGVLGGIVVSAFGGWLLISGSGFYLGAILAWSGPILAIQWGFGWPYLVRTWRMGLLGVAVPTVYLWAADWLAITRWELWTFDPAFLIGVTPAGLPVEELLFFFMTNLFVIQGLILWMWLLDQLGRLRHSTEYIPRAGRFSSTE